MTLKEVKINIFDYLIRFLNETRKKNGKELEEK